MSTYVRLKTRAQETDLYKYYQEVKTDADPTRRHAYKKTGYKIGSYLTEPWCKSREHTMRLLSVDELHGDKSSLNRSARKAAHVVAIIGFGALGVITVPIGMAVRASLAATEKEPYIFHKSAKPTTAIPESGEIKVLSWNICAVGGGYSISDGGITPIEDRLDRVVEAIGSANAEVACLYEVFDVVTAEALQEKLKKKGYTHFIYNIGPRGLGNSSGLFVASKVAIGEPEFTRFSKKTLVGRTKFANKGVIGFSVMKDGKPAAKVYATHLQHSEQLDNRKAKEIHGRLNQMSVVEALANRSELPTIITGDLNMNDTELEGQNLTNKYKKGHVKALSGKTSWGGDAWCANLMGKNAAKPQNLDYTLSNKPIKTVYAFENHFNPDKITEKALSDHRPLLTTINIKK